MVVELDPAVRTTRDWEGPVVAPRVSAALEAALRPLDEDLNIDASLATLNHSQAVKSTRKAKGKLTPYDEIDAVIKNNKQTMSRIIPEIQEWVAAPYAVAGQFHVPKIPRFGSKVTTPKSWTPRGSVVHQDDYDEDPYYYSMTMQERLDQDSCIRESTEPKVERVIEEEDDNVLKKISVMSHSRNPSGSSRISLSSEKSKGFSESQLVDIEEYSVFNSQKGTRLILGPFGARRTCYHYRPQVKRCLTTVFKISSRNVLLGCSCCSENQRIPVNCPHSSSRNLFCSENVDFINKRLCPKLSHASKKCCLNRFCHQSVSTKSLSKLQMGSVAQKFSCLTRKKRLQWRAPMRPCVYERVLWRLPSSLWKQLTLCLLNFEDNDMLHFLTPVMFSLRRFSGLSESRMVYSLSHDSYGVTERAREDLVTALCLCCVLMFMYRVYGGIYGCLSEVMDWISW